MSVRFSWPTSSERHPPVVYSTPAMVAEYCTQKPVGSEPADEEFEVFDDLREEFERFAESPAAGSMRAQSTGFRALLRLFHSELLKSVGLDGSFFGFHVCP